MADFYHTPRSQHFRTEGSAVEEIEDELRLISLKRRWSSSCPPGNRVRYTFNAPDQDELTSVSYLNKIVLSWTGQLDQFGR